MIDAYVTIGFSALCLAIGLMRVIDAHAALIRARANLTPAEYEEVYGEPQPAPNPAPKPAPLPVARVVLR